MGMDEKCVCVCDVTATPVIANAGSSSVLWLFLLEMSVLPHGTQGWKKTSQNKPKNVDVNTILKRRGTLSRYKRQQHTSSARWVWLLPNVTVSNQKVIEREGKQRAGSRSYNIEGNFTWRSGLEQTNTCIYRRAVITLSSNVPRGRAT